jgi:outer membrane lipoprotein SlyB
MESTGFIKTHPLVLGAAASVIVVSLVGAAAIGGLLPGARSDKTDTPAQRSAPAADSARHGVPTRIEARDGACASCGTVESIRALELKGNATGRGTVAGGATGAVAGNEIEWNVKKRYSYRVTVRMDDGSYRTLSQSSAPAVAVGERVRVVDSTVIASS